MSFLTLSNYAGLAATAVLTFNILWGMMLSTAYKKHNYWKRLPGSIKKINVYNLHNWTAYAALSLVLLHPTLLLFDSTTKFKFVDIIFPVNAPHQKLYVALGVLAMYAIITVIVTTQKVVKKKMNYRTWKNIHLVSYGTALLFIVHGIVMDPQLKDRPIDIFDAEKILSEACLLLLIAATILRVRYQLKIKQNIKQFHLLKIAEVIKETNLAKSFVFEIPQSLKKQLQNSPGQFIIIQLTINGKQYKRSYSLSSSPFTETKTQITIKRIPKGIVSNYLNDTLKANDELLVFPPSGNFVIKNGMDSQKNYFFYAGGSGITPIYSIIKTLLHKYPQSRLNLIYANRDEHSIIFNKQLENLQQTNTERFFITHILSEASGGWNGMKGRLDKDKMKEFLDHAKNFPIDHTEYYICGPSPFMELVEHELLDHQIPADKIHIERFISIGDAEEAIIVGDAPTEMNITESKVLVTLDDIKQTVVCKANDPILNALLNAGINAPYSCREGVCSTCLAKLISGKVEMKNHASLTDIDIQESRILTCQAVALSKEVEINYDNL